MMEEGIAVGVVMTVGIEILIFVIWKILKIVQSRVEKKTDEERRQNPGTEFQRINDPTNSSVPSNPSDSVSVQQGSDADSSHTSIDISPASGCNHNNANDIYNNISCSCGINKLANLDTIQEESGSTGQLAALNSGITVDNASTTAQQQMEETKPGVCKLRRSQIPGENVGHFQKRSSSFNLIDAPHNSRRTRIDRSSSAASAISSICSSFTSESPPNTRPCSCWTATSMEVVKYENDEHGDAIRTMCIVNMLVPQTCCNISRLQESHVSRAHEHRNSCAIVPCKTDSIYFQKDTGVQED